jgi:hypothetical protein
MGARMKTTVDIADPLFEEAKALAERERTTLRALIEEGLRAVLAGKTQAKPFRLRDMRFKGCQGLSPEFAEADWSRIREAAYDWEKWRKS